MENLIKMDDLGVPLFLETPIYTYETESNCCEMFNTTSGGHQNSEHVFVFRPAKMTFCRYHGAPVGEKMIKFTQISLVTRHKKPRSKMHHKYQFCWAPDAPYGWNILPIHIYHEFKPKCR